MPVKRRATRVLLSVAALFLVGTGIARSQDIPATDRALRLAAAEPALQYNFPYSCNQEHIVIGHCRRDSDEPGMPRTTPQDDFCQVYYPDRPKRGGLEAMGVELRGDLIKTLSACGAFGAPAAGLAGSPKPSSSATAQGAATARPSQVGDQATSRADMRKQFCDQVLQLRALAPQGFSSIDLGPMKGEPAHIHSTSVRLPSTDQECFIGRKAGEQASYSCSWELHQESAETQFQGMGNLLAHCLGVRPDWSLMREVGILQLDLESANVEYFLIGEQGLMMLNVQPAKH